MQIVIVGNLLSAVVFLILYNNHFNVSFEVLCFWIGLVGVTTSFIFNYNQLVLVELIRSYQLLKQSNFYLSFLSSVDRLAMVVNIGLFLPILNYFEHADGSMNQKVLVIFIFLTPAIGKVLSTLMLLKPFVLNKKAMQ